VSTNDRRREPENVLRAPDDASGGAVPMVVLESVADAVAHRNGAVAAPPRVSTPPEAPTRETVLEPLPGDIAGSMALGQSISSALEAIGANKLRSILTMLGIIIGVGAVIVMIALGAGARAAVQQRLQRLGTNLLTITPGSGFGGGVRVGAGSLPTLNDADVQAVQKQVSGIETVSPNLDTRNVQVVANGQNWNTTVQANYPSIFGIQDWQIAEGAAYDDTDETSQALVVDIGQTVATNLFGDQDPIGQRINIRNVPFTVKGLLVSKGSNGFQDQDDIILMPYSTAQVRIFHQTFVNDVYVQVASSDNISNVQAEITDLLHTRHHILPGKPDDFRVNNNNQIIQTVQQTSDTLTLLLAGVAAVSLIVGGIGIMNIMLVSVTERTREIGIRLAIGARTANILSQFLIEAVLLSLVGGLLGVAIGIGTSVGLAQFANWNTLVTPESVFMSFGFAALVGVFFGFYPARKASQLDPIEALRYE
jgi:putative ABC transport system permease protein